MSNYNEVTATHSFGSGKDNKLILMELDPEKHTDNEGSQVDIGPQDSAWLLLHHHSDVTIVRLKTTDDSDLQKHGTVTREVEKEYTFTHAEDEITLSHFPSATPSAVEWYGRVSKLVLDGRKLSAPGAPCTGLIKYSYEATQYVNSALSGLALEEDEEWPTDVIIEHQFKE